MQTGMQSYEYIYLAIIKRDCSKFHTTQKAIKGNNKKQKHHTSGELGSKNAFTDPVVFGEK